MKINMKKVIITTLGILALGSFSFGATRKSSKNNNPRIRFLEEQRRKDEARRREEQRRREETKKFFEKNNNKKNKISASRAKQIALSRVPGATLKNITDFDFD